MNTLDQILGRRSEPRAESQRRAAAGGAPAMDQPSAEQAIERYRYLLRTATPEAIEEAHAEAFAQLTADQRRLVLEGLSSELPPRERTDRDDPQSLARMATRAELRRPGTLERTFGGIGPGGLGGFLAADFLSTIAGVVVGSAIADAIFNDGGYEQGNADGAEATDAGYDGNAAYNAAGGGDVDFGGGEF
jgi:hypothetical protein